MKKFTNSLSQMFLLLFSLSVVSDFLRPHGPQHARLPCPFPPPRICSLMSIESVMPSNRLVFCHPLLLPSIFPSIRVFSMSQLIFCFSISPSNEYSRLISFRTDWLDLLAVQGSLKSLLQQHSSKSLSSSVVSLLYGPTLTSIYDYWKYHSFDLTDLCR